MINKKILVEYDNNKNEYPISYYKETSGTQLWWKCKYGHEWRQALNLRTAKNNRGCITCRSLGFQFPKILKLFHPKKNTNLDPNKLTFGSDTIAWWICSKGHEWQKKVKDVIKDPKCLECNSIQVLFPNLVKEWDYKKNKKLKPNQFTHGSDKKVWWICKNKHEYQAAIGSRTRGSGCGKCTNATSLPEIRVYTELFTIFEKIEHREIYFKKELDIFIPDFKIGIEYDGSYWHQNNKKDINKNIFFQNMNIKIIRVREKPLKKISNLDIICDVKKLKKENINSLLKNIAHLTNESTKNKIDNYIKKDNFQNEKKYFDIASRLPLPEVEKSLATLRPKIAKEWHPTKNLPLLPTMVNKSSTKNVWWKCENNHEWQWVIDGRNKKGKKVGNCKVCESIGFNFPLISKQISDKNIFSNFKFKKREINNFSDLSIESPLILWWECENNHLFKREVRDAVKTKNKFCFECKSLGFLYPKIAEEFNYTKNKNFRPNEINYTSKKNIWWICKNNHEWKASVANRTRYPNSSRGKCAKCRSLGFMFPELSKEFHPTKNKMSVFDLTFGSDEKVWWRCKINKNHIWKTRVSARTNKLKPTGCRHCSGKL